MARTDRSHWDKGDPAERHWYVVDAEGQTLGRLATRVATILRGKHKPSFTPGVDTGDHVIIVNASRVRLTGQKLQKKLYYRHTGHPRGLKVMTYDKFLSTWPERVVEKAVRGMLPHTPLGRQMFRKLKVYAGAKHPHDAQKPEVLTLTSKGSA